ncbi:hypothetical protein POTOM_021783 [Populus tomentosa]|uniref:Uncharacterized protein n=1 Tax=Populus tomentosa TaxID=118781 RepID=A0A8X8A4M4_POPTO|nr:hypothetical protein POTOM_021783 [Populus tomentosa]
MESCEDVCGISLFFLVYPLISASNQLIQWDPPTSDKVDDSKVDLVFRPFKDDLELQNPENEEHGWNGKYEHSAYAAINGMEKAKKTSYPCSEASLEAIFVL